MRDKDQQEKPFLFLIAMKLIDRDLVELAAHGNQDTIPDPVVIARFICTTSPAVWLVTWFDHVSGYASDYRSGQGNDDGWSLFNILELGRMLIPTDTFFFDNKFGGTIHRQSYGRIVRDGQFTPRRLSDCIPLRERLLGVPELKARKEELQEPVIMKPEPVETPANENAAAQKQSPDLPTGRLKHSARRER